MDREIFEMWFHDKFVPRVKHFCRERRIEYKGLLLLDNAPSHPSTEKLQSADGKVTAMFLPPNTTSVIQPMDQGVLAPLKLCYRKSLLRYVVAKSFNVVHQTRQCRTL